MIADRASYYYPDLLAPYLLEGEAYHYLGQFEKSKEALMKCINEKTEIKSSDTNQISNEAKKLWDKYGYNKFIMGDSVY